MGKKGSWFSAIKRVFIPNSKQKLDNFSLLQVPEKKSGKEKKKGVGILGNGESKSFIPFFRQPSSIEKILEEAEQHNLFINPNTTIFDQPKPPPSLALGPPSPIVASPRATSPPLASPRAVSPRYGEVSYRPETIVRDPQLSAIKIQTAYRGYMARRSFRTLKGLVRLQRVVRSQNVKRQTIHAIKQMQLLVRVQTQIQTRRIQMVENKSFQTQAYNNDKESGTTLSKWSFNQVSEAGDREEWDDSVLKREEVEAKMQKKAEAVMKRERAMTYGYSNQLWKAKPKSAQTNPTNIRLGGFPWWWNPLERQLPSSNLSETQSSKNIHQTPPRKTPSQKPTPQPQTSNYKQQNLGFDHHESVTPRSSKSTPPLSRTRKPHTPSNKTPTPPSKSSNLSKYSRPRTLDALMKDDDSLVSCPPFSVPNYMAPTVSAKAKVRANGEPKRRFSLPLSSNIGSFKWNKGSSKGSSVDSVTSMPAAFGRKPFNRFV